MRVSISDKLYGPLLHLYVGEPWKTVIKDVLKVYPGAEKEDILKEEGDVSCAGITHAWDGPAGLILGIRMAYLNLACPQCLGTLTHEVAHATFHVLGRADIITDVARDPKQEAFCYLSSYYLTSFLEQLKKRKYKGKCPHKKYLTNT